MEIVASHIERARARVRASRRTAAPWRPTALPDLEERYAELEELVRAMIVELPKLRQERDELKGKLDRALEELELYREGQR